VLLVGGAVRDLLLGNQTPKDWDLLTSAHLSEVRQTHSLHTLGHTMHPAPHKHTYVQTVLLPHVVSPTLTQMHVQVKHLLPKPRIFGRTVPICQLDVDGVRIEISSMHTRPLIRVAVTAAAAAAGDAAAAGVPPDASQILQAGPKAAVAAAAAAAAAAGGQVGACWLDGRIVWSACYAAASSSALCRALCKPVTPCSRL
jgi:hypothetical protein